MKTLLGLVFLLTTHLSLAQNRENSRNPEAKVILEDLALAINGHKDLTYQFQLTIDYPETEPEIIRGKYQQQGVKYRLETPGYVFVCNGTTKWVVDEKGKEIQIHDFVKSEGDSDISDPQALLKIYANPHYDYRLLFEGPKDGREVQLVEFKPIERTGEMAKATLIIDKQLKQIIRMEVINKDGSKLHLLIEDTITDLNLSVETFQVLAEDFPGYHLEDLRIE